MENKIYKISVRTPNGVTLTYWVDYYSVLEGGLIKFLDKKYNIEKIFDSRLCEIEVHDK